MVKRKRYFQWVAGEDIGEVVMLDHMYEFEGEIFYEFDDGESCNLRYISKKTDNQGDLREKFMVEIDSPSNPWISEIVESKKYIDESMKGEDINIPTLYDILQAKGQTAEITNSDLGTTKLTPPRRQQNFEELPRFEDYAMQLPSPASATEQEQPKQEVAPKPVVTQPVVQQHVADEPIVETPKKVTKLSDRKPISSDPVRILADTCKKHPTEVEFSLTMNLPSSAVYDIADSEFENGGDKFVDYVVDNVDVSEIINQLRVTLKEEYASKKIDKSENQ